MSLAAILLIVHIILLKLFQVLMFASFYFSMPVIFEILIGDDKKGTGGRTLTIKSPDSELIQTCLHHGRAARNLKIRHIIRLSLESNVLLHPLTNTYSMFYGKQLLTASFIQYCREQVWQITEVMYKVCVVPSNLSQFIWLNVPSDSNSSYVNLFILSRKHNRLEYFCVQLAYVTGVKSGKTRTSKSRLVLVWLPIG